MAKSGGMFARLFSVFSPDSTPKSSDGPLSGNIRGGAGGPLIREAVDQGYRIRLDLRKQVLSVDAPADRQDGAFDAETREAEIFPTLGDVRGEFVSASLLAQKAKVFDDGLYAAIELAADDGHGTLGGKRGFVKALAAALTGSERGDQPAELVFAALSLQSDESAAPAALQDGVGRRLTDFHADPQRSKPIGFYTWSDNLARIFQRDRLLQTGLEGADAVMRLAKAILADGSLSDTYVAHLQLASKLTNPPAGADLRPLLNRLGSNQKPSIESPMHLFPPSRSHEADLIRQLYGDRPIPEGFILVDELIRRIRNGQAKLTPKPESGWYDYQTWSLEPLASPDKTPEAAKLACSPRYKEQLAELFRGFFALARETHVKQLETPMCGMAAFGSSVRLHITPNLEAEPLAEFYRRKAESYRFVRSVLNASFGDQTLSCIHRLTPEGAVEPSLANELEEMERLFYGAYLATLEAIGLDRGGEYAEEAALAAFRAWARNHQRDPDVGGDSRMMVPVYFDLQRKKTKAWVFLGWSIRPIHVGYTAPPDLVDVQKGGNLLNNDAVHLQFGRQVEWLPYPVTAEAHVSRLLDRNEMRDLCDRHRTRSAILRKLQEDAGSP